MLPTRTIPPQLRHAPAVRHCSTTHAETAALALVLCLFTASFIPPDSHADEGTSASTSSQSVSPESLEFFERKIRPVLVEHCTECHSAQSDVVQGGFRVDDERQLLGGGDSGSAILPGDPDGSLLLAALRYDGMEMPPDQPLPENVIRDFERWIREGAAMPGVAGVDVAAMGSDSDSGIDWQSAKSFWAFQSPVRHDASEILPSVPDRLRWSQTPIDPFVHARLEQHGMRPNAPADKTVWLRRVTYDLTGLPPTVEQTQQFLSDNSPLARQRVVDQLLASPRYAERWARMWLDVARYAEDQAHIVGNNDSLTYPNAFLYRDWVIDAFASDMPYDEFVRMQLAADKLYPDQPERQVALGFIGLGPKYYRRGDLEVMADEWEDRVDTVTRGLLGLTVACARCHDHKYDPIPTSDYYALAGVFASTEMFNRPLSDEVETKGDQAAKPQDAVHIVREGKPKNLNVMIRGDVKRLGDQVPRGFLTVLSEPDAAGFEDGSGRLELAESIVCSDGPLAARVIINRVWDQLMGTPLVDTPSNFGALGSTPSHPLLLDDLAVRFVAAGWSMKWLMREIVLSATYGQSSDIDPQKSQSDPENRLRWRMPRRRMSVEAYRDAVLAVCGQLDTAVGGPSMDPQDVDATRRTVYSKVSRLDLNPMLARFDFPDPNAHSPRRHETTTPLQKLFLLNSPFLVEHSKTLARRMRSVDGDDRARIGWAYQLMYSRKPSPRELELAMAFVADGELESWNSLAQALLISNEMFVLD